MIWLPTAPMVITGCADGVARCWDLRTGGLVQQYGGHTAVIQVRRVGVVLRRARNTVLTSHDAPLCLAATSHRKTSQS